MSQKYHPKELLNWCNENFAVIAMAGEVRVIRKSDHQLFKDSSFRTLVNTRRTNKGAPASKFWLQHPSRNFYPNGIEFYPSERIIDGVYNTWSGWPIGGKAGDTSLFLSFIKEIICSGNTDHYDFVIAWMADLIQRPESKSGTALILRGGQGTGKNTFVDIFGKLFGENFLTLSDPKHLTGQFNGHLRDALLVFADEGAFTGKAAANKLKHLVTASQQLIEEKFQTPYTCNNFSRIIIAGNNKKLIEADFDERRYCILDVSSDKKSDREYWNRLHQWAESERAMEALMYELQHYQYNADDLRTAPNTAALLDHKINSLEPFESWYYDCLEEGEICNEPWSVQHFTAALFKDYIDSRELKGGRAAKTRFGQKLHKYMPDIKRQRGTRTSSASRKREYYYLFPSLEQCRADFESYLGHPIPWQDSDSDDQGCNVLAFT